jgi:ribosomal protein S18 acetylase RimI-like enzyme
MFRTRAARRDDHAAYQRLQPQVGTDQPPFEIDWWDQHYRVHTTLLETESGEIVGYALTVPLGTRGDVRQLVVDQAWRGRGAGRLLLDAVARKLREAGCRDWHLEVLVDNEPAIALYRSVGMSLIHEIDVLRLTRAIAEQVAATRSGRLRVEPVDLTHDAGFEARFDLGAGQLARWRTARPKAVMWRIGDVALTHYMKDFLPDCGLLFPFRAPDADHAAHLFAEACARGINDLVELCAVDRVVSELLRNAGAVAYEHQLEMGGPL